MNILKMQSGSLVARMPLEMWSRAIDLSLFLQTHACNPLLLPPVARTEDVYGVTQAKAATLHVGRWFLLHQPTPPQPLAIVLDRETGRAPHATSRRHSSSDAAPSCRCCYYPTHQTPNLTIKSNGIEFYATSLFRCGPLLS